MCVALAQGQYLDRSGNPPLSDPKGLFHGYLVALDSGRLEQADEFARGIARSAQTDAESLAALKLIAGVAWRQGRLGEADGLMDLANWLLDFSPDAELEQPFLRTSILSEQVLLAIRGERDWEKAIDLYDQIAQIAVPGNERTRLNAMGSAAALVYLRGSPSEAVSRYQAILQSDLGKAAPLERQESWHLCIAQSFERLGDFESAIAVYQKLWSESGDRASVPVILAGTSVARSIAYSADCDLIVSMAQDLLGRIRRFASSRPSLEAVEAAEVDDMEQSVLVILANTAPCPGKEAIAAGAKARLKPPYRTPAP
jgi:tetratricopeptide (TPR) repeat protein